ncbi:MAG: hypothetical protein J6J17_00895 [Bacilli bacterium]|nr:hypothetical protein [Bacilli bacterium]
MKFLLKRRSLAAVNDMIYENELSNSQINYIASSIKGKNISIDQLNIFVEFTSDILNNDAKKNIINVLCEMLKRGINESECIFNIIERLCIDKEQLSQIVCSFNDIGLELDALSSNLFNNYHTALIDKIINNDMFNNFSLLFENIDFINKTDAQLVLSKIYEIRKVINLHSLLDHNDIDEQTCSLLLDLIFENQYEIDAEYFNLDRVPEYNKNRIKIVENVCKNMNDSNQLFEYPNKYNLTTDELALVVKKLRELNDKNVLIKALNSDTYADFHNEIFEAICNFDNIGYTDISLVKIENLNESNKQSYLKIALSNFAPAELLDFAISNSKYYIKDDIKLITNKICECNYPKVIYLYLLNMNDIISVGDIDKLAKKLIELNNIEYLYLTSRNISNLSDDVKKEIRKKVLNSLNYKYICLYALFVDTLLINKLFKNKYKMYEYILLSNMYNSNELKEIESEIFKCKTNIEQRELKLTKKIINMSE